MTIYIVMRQTRDYEEFCESDVVAYRDENLATEHAALAQTTVDLWAEMSDTERAAANGGKGCWDPPKGWNKHDPEMPLGAYYGVRSLEMRETLP